MIATKLLGTVSTLVLATGLVVLPAQAAGKNCNKLCKGLINTCTGALPAPSSCTGSASEKRACKKKIAKNKKDCHKNTLKLCRDRKATAAADKCSPSGAFLDAVSF